MHKLVSFIIALVLFIPLFANAQPADHLVISELQTGSSGSAGDEFVEIYNPTNTAIDLDGLRLEYRSAAGTTWYKKAEIISGELEPFRFFLFGAGVHQEKSDQTFNSGLAAGGGSIRLLQGGNVIDLIGWGSSTAYEGNVAPGVPAGSSLERKAGALSASSGNGVDSDNNSEDFLVRLASEPQNSSNSEIFAEVDFVAAAPAGGQPTVLQITELMPNPEGSDSTEEFIEVYNPNAFDVDLGGWKLEDKYGSPKSFELSGTIRAKDYIVFKSSETKISLNNDKDQVVLVDPTGEVVSSSDPYESAEEGQSWNYTGGRWQWSSSPTPLVDNEIVAPTVSGKTAAQKKAVKAKAAKSKASKAKAAKAKRPLIAAGSNDEIDLTDPKNQNDLAGWIVLGLSLTALGGYIIYLKHEEIRNFIKKLRPDFRARKKTGGETFAERIDTP